MNATAGFVAAAEPAKAEAPKSNAGSDLLRDIRRTSAPILATMAKNHYSLKAGQNLRRVPPPFPPERMEYYRSGHPSQAKAIPGGPSGMVFHDRGGRLSNWGMTFNGGDGYSLSGLLDALLGIKKQAVEGGEVLDKIVPGDWVIRRGAKQDEVLKELETILQQELSLRVRIEWSDVERPVYVVRGTYRFTALDGGRTEEKLITADRTAITTPIEIYGGALVPNSGAGGGTGQFDELLDWLGRWIDKPIVSEVKEKPAGKFSWHLHERSPSTAQTRRGSRSGTRLAQHHGANRSDIRARAATGQDVANMGAAPIAGSNLPASRPAAPPTIGGSTEQRSQRDFESNGRHRTRTCDFHRVRMAL